MSRTVDGEHGMCSAGRPRRASNQIWGVSSQSAEKRRESGLTGLPVLLRMEQERSTEHCVEIDMKDTVEAIHGAVKLEIRPNSTVRITESW